MRSNTFLLSSLLAFICLVLGYFISIDSLAIPRTPFGKSYRQFLLAASDGIEGRILIEGGSNSIFGIDAMQMEKHFGRLTIVIADNAGYPLKHKIYRLRQHLHAGDTVILPLEWMQYKAEVRLPADYVDSIIDAEGSNAFYYRELPLMEKFFFVMQDLPFASAIKSAISLNALPSRNPALGAAVSSSLVDFRGALLQSNRGSHMHFDNVPMEPLTAGLTCDHFIFGLWGLPRVSKTFLKNLDLLAQLKDETHANIVFTWPAVVGRDGNECYGLLTGAIDAFVAEIESNVAQHGFAFVGRKEQARFDHRCMRDTYYHLRPDCATKRTQLLIDSIEKAGVIKKGGDPVPDFNATLMEYLLKHF